MDSLTIQQIIENATLVIRQSLYQLQRLEVDDINNKELIEASDKLASVLGILTSKF